MDSKELFKEVCQKIIKVKTALHDLKKQNENLKTQLAEKEREIAELKELREKARWLGNNIFEWFAELKKISSILDKSKAFFKSKTIAEARKQVEKITNEMNSKIKTWSI